MGVMQQALWARGLRPNVEEMGPACSSRCLWRGIHLLFLPSSPAQAALLPLHQLFQLLRLYSCKPAF